MSVIALEAETIHYNREGKPTEVVIPYSKYIEFVEAYGLDLTKEEEEGILEAEADLAAGNKEAFASMEEVRREFGCTK